MEKWNGLIQQLIDNVQNICIDGKTTTIFEHSRRDIIAAIDITLQVIQNQIDLIQSHQF